MNKMVDCPHCELKFGKGGLQAHIRWRHSDTHYLMFKNKGSSQPNASKASFKSNKQNASVALSSAKTIAAKATLNSITPNATGSSSAAENTLKADTRNSITPNATRASRSSHNISVNLLTFMPKYEKIPYGMGMIWAWYFYGVGMVWVWYGYDMNIIW